MIIWVIWCVYNLKNVKNIHKGVLLFVKLQVSACNFTTKSNIPAWSDFQVF